MVLIRPRLPDDEDFDPLEIVVLPKAIHTLCRTMAEDSDDESAAALLEALQFLYHPLLNWNHLIALVYEIDDEMLQTVDDVGVLLLLSAGGLLNALVPGYCVYYAIDGWRIALGEKTVATKTLADAIKHTAKLRRAEKRRKRG